MSKNIRVVVTITSEGAEGVRTIIEGDVPARFITDDVVRGTGLYLPTRSRVLAFVIAFTTSSPSTPNEIFEGLPGELKEEFMRVRGEEGEVTFVKFAAWLDKLAALNVLAFNITGEGRYYTT
jgi:hypothetical protein